MKNLSSFSLFIFFPNNTLFWSDLWIDDEVRLKNWVPNEESLSDRLALVNSFLNNDGGWGFARMLISIPPNIVTKIRAIPTPFVLEGIDGLAWVRSKDGKFSVKSAYYLRTGYRSPSPNWIW